MIEATHLLRSYLDGLCELSGAVSVSLFVSAPHTGASRALLLHRGEHPPVPELSDLEAAEKLLPEREPVRALGGGDTGFTAPRVLPSRAEDGCLVPLPALYPAWWLEETAGGEPRSRGENRGRRKTDDPAERPAELPAAWIGLRFGEGSAEPAARFGSESAPAMELLAAEPARWWSWLLALGGALAGQMTQMAAILRDPVTGLPDLAGLHSVLGEELNRARIQKRPVAVLMVNPDDFGPVNERFGREAGDRIIVEITDNLRSALRVDDPVFRYGGVIFSVVLPGLDLEQARSVAAKVLQSLSEPAYLEGAVRLAFSIGIAVAAGDDVAAQQTLELIRRADQALNAVKRLGGAQYLDWEQGAGAEEAGNFDRLSGIYTGHKAKDYRNMALLRDIIDVIALHDDFQGLAERVVDRLSATFKPERVGLLVRQDDGELRLVRGLTRFLAARSAQQNRMETLELTPEESDLVSRSIETQEPERAGGDDATDGGRRYVVPLVATEESLGCLFIQAQKDTPAFDDSDIIFLKALSSQLAVALDRARLAELERHRGESERRQLLTELKTLRQAVRQAKMVYRSERMERVVGLARRVAPTDATILVTGESGTGKELLAHTIHELSHRRKKPFIIIDLGAIATTLIESELFGHEKGAFTGAQQRREGRLIKADGGTVLLDEIDVLPLEVQSKLLRFVQDRQFTMVGSNRPKQVDVRILAATNSDLRLEVEKGRFREDLYHRLNVVRMELPPLRDRPEDILHLSQHFLESFAVQYHRAPQVLGEEAQALLLRHEWPGNVRELQNRIMRAVILCEGATIGAGELGLPAESGNSRISLADSRTAAPSRTAPRTSDRDSVEPAGGPVPASVQPIRSGDTVEELTRQLREVLGREIDATASTSSGPTMPLGRWLKEDLVLEADRLTHGVARQGAGVLGLPVSTYRRRLLRARDLLQTGLSPRSGTWEEVRSLLSAVVRNEELRGRHLLKWGEACLLDEIVRRFPDEEKRGADLLGVTPLTYRRRLESHRPQPREVESEPPVEEEAPPTSESVDDLEEAVQFAN